MLKEALERRKTGELPSNFTFRMMQQVQQEVVRRKKRNRMLFRISFVASVLFVLGLLVYVLFFYLGIQPKEFFLQLEIPKVSSDYIGFYFYIGALALILLGLDHWLRYRYRHRKTAGE